MSAEQSQGLVLRVTDFSETSRIVVLFTRDFGRLSALAKGGRRLRGPFENSLDLLAEVSVVFLKKTNTQLDLLTEAQLLHRFQPAPQDMSAYYAGYYVAELLLATTEDYDPHPALYEAARNTLAALSSADRVHLEVLRFELVLLREIGQLPDFETCAGCGKALTGQGLFGYWVSQSGLICPACQKEGYSQLLIHAGTAVMLRALSAEGDTWQRLVPTLGQLKEMRSITTSALSSILGHRPKLLKYLQPAPRKRQVPAAGAPMSPDDLDDAASREVHDVPQVPREGEPPPVEGSSP